MAVDETGENDLLTWSMLFLVLAMVAIDAPDTLAELAFAAVAFMGALYCIYRVIKIRGGDA